MMTAPTKSLADEAARVTAIGAHDRSLLVEAGAGSGKTAVMAGRIAIMLADGIKPKSIAAVTFTELAASELLSRVREYVEELIAGRIPIELARVLPQGLNDIRKKNLQIANTEFDEITCSTIHGFCQNLIKPYPVEANIDPGATVMGRGDADLLFVELVDGWIRERLSGADGALIAEMVSFDPRQTVKLIRQVADCLRRGRTIEALAAIPVGQSVQAFLDCVAAFRGFAASCSAQEADTLKIIASFEKMAVAVRSTTCDDDATLVRLVTTQVEEGLCRKSDGGFLAYRKKGKWAAAAKSVGLSKADANQLNDQAGIHYLRCGAAWSAMLANSASQILTKLVAEIRPLITRFHDSKRRTAVLDFDDLIFAARDLLRNHETVRRALGARYAFVLVDEFQDTDPFQTEIFWRLCGNPPKNGSTEDWTRFRIRSGALFLVGDPKQAIYRFRGADVNAYVRAREAIRAANPKNIVSISTNFRSCKSILAYVNGCFENILSGAGQPGFIALHPYHDDHGDAPAVAALDVAVPGNEGNASADLQRDCEAEAVADLCSRMIGRRLVIDRKSGGARECRAGDIALLAPTGSDLWRYEEALEKHDISVSTQAGKGLYRRQEIQDLIALTRVLADSRDTLALGALLRGPIVGLTEEELLDMVWALPRSGTKSDRLPRLDRRIDPQHVTNEVARDILLRIHSLARRTNSTTPHDLLSQAVDVLRIRPILIQRHRGHAERALANVDLYLDLARPYAVRGLRAFAEAMTNAWTDEARAVEGRPDAQEEAVSLYTMHAAKGLEWPIVIPINTLTRTIQAELTVIDRDTDHLYCPVFGVHPTGYDEVRDAEKAEIDRERVRLWYVATTRARELLILPRVAVQPVRTAWIALVDLALSELPAINLAALPSGNAVAPTRVANNETREAFAAEAAKISEKTLRLEWIAPSRGEDGDVIAHPEVPAVLTPAEEDGSEEDSTIKPVQGGRERGLVIHKLFEEVLTGETTDDLASLIRRADELIRSMGSEPAADASIGLSPTEIAGCVDRGLSVPQIAKVRDSLVPEFPVYSSSVSGPVETITSGIADAIAIDENRSPVLVVDWKSDVSIAAETLDHYRAQVRSYLETVGTPRGLIVFVTSGDCVEIVR
jgi:ATP-dependent exoDNAse (exonuclease V) beta subunit